MSLWINFAECDPRDHDHELIGHGDAADNLKKLKPLTPEEELAKLMKCIVDGVPISKDLGLNDYDEHKGTATEDEMIEMTDRVVALEIMIDSQALGNVALASVS